MAKKCCRHLLVLRTIEQSKTTESQHDPLSNHRIDNSHKLCHYVSSFQIDALQLRGEHIFFHFKWMLLYLILQVLSRILHLLFEAKQ